MIIFIIIIIIKNNKKEIGIESITHNNALTC